MTRPSDDPPGPPRPTVEPDGAAQRVRVAAYAWTELDDAVLLVRMAPHEPGAGRWTLPGGGLSFGEAPEDGMRREVREETGLDAEPVELLGVRSAMIGPEVTKSGARIQAIGVLYRARITGGELRHETDESTDLAAWVPFGDLGELPVVPLVRWARGLAGR